MKKSKIFIACDTNKIKQVKILPDNSEKYKPCKIGNLHFLDTFRYMALGLDT